MAIVAITVHGQDGRATPHDTPTQVPEFDVVYNLRWRGKLYMVSKTRGGGERPLIG
jgi:hypothetical protein